MSQKIVFQVQGMDCEGCERSISNALSPLEGVDAVRASFQDGKVEVEGNPDQQAVRDAIEAAGYDVVSA